MKHIGIIILTIISAVVIFFRIGNTYAPESFYEITPENTNIVLNFDKNITVSRIDIYLGSKNDRTFSLSSYDFALSVWEVIEVDAVASSVFRWNNILGSPHDFSSIGLVSIDMDASIGEIVIVDANGSMVLPVNAEDFPTLFDEQEKYSLPHNYTDGTFFDEIYHGRTGYEFIHHLNTYETVHPPLGKIIISLGIRLFGMTPFGWRFMPALFGVLIIPLMYVFGLLIFDGNRFSALMAPILLSLDFMHFTLARIATIDSIAAFFILASFYGMYGFVKYEKIPYLYISSVSVSLAIATKWTGLYAGFGLAVIFFIYLFKSCSLDKKILFIRCVTLFILLPIIVYVLSFIPVVDGTQSALFARAINASKNMFSYHSDLNATHPYGSKWFEWPILVRPILYALDNMGNNKLSTISLMGNPIIYWSGIPCIVAVIMGYLRKKQSAYILLCGYLVSFMPWIFISRVLFLYHYYPSAIFMIMIIGCTLDSVVRLKYGKAICIGFICLCAMAFIVYFPVISGFPVDRSYGLWLQLFDTWVFSY